MLFKNIIAAVFLAAGACAQSSTKTASTAASAPTTTVDNRVIVIIKPYANTTIAPGSTIQITWSFNSAADASVTGSTPLTLQLEDLRKGATNGVMFYQFSGVASKVGDLQASVVVPTNTPNGTFAFATYVKGIYYSGPSVIIAGGNSTVSTTNNTTATASSTVVATTIGNSTASPTTKASNNTTSTPAAAASVAVASTRTGSGSARQGDESRILAVFVSLLGAVAFFL